MTGPPVNSMIRNMRAQIDPSCWQTGDQLPTTNATFFTHYLYSFKDFDENENDDDWMARRDAASWPTPRRFHEIGRLCNE